MLDIFFIYKLLAPPKTWCLKPIFPEKQLEEIAVKSQMSQIKYRNSLSRKSLVKKIGFQIFL